MALLLSLALVAGCATVAERGKATDDNRQFLLTVNQPEDEHLSLAGAVGRRYLKRTRYGRTPATERLLDRIAADYGLIRHDGWLIDTLSLYCEVFEVTGDQPVQELLIRLAGDPRVDSVQPMQTFEVMDGRYDDPFFELQTAARRLRISNAHEWADGSGVSIAVIDTGIDATHPDLAGRIAARHSFLNKHGQKRSLDHGTAVAGVIASTANNHIGIVGVAPGADLLALEACWQAEPEATAARCSSFTLAQAIETAIGEAADVINLSLAGPADPLLGRLVRAAIERGITVVGAAPPDRVDRDYFPGSVNGVIAVHSAEALPFGADDPPAAGELAAPGAEILTLTPPNGYDFRSGSSLAAGHVSGVAALLLEREPRLSPARLALLLSAGGHGKSIPTVDACGALSMLEGRATCGVRLGRRRNFPAP